MELGDPLCKDADNVCWRFPAIFGGLPADCTHKHGGYFSLRTRLQYHWDIDLNGMQPFGSFDFSTQVFNVPTYCNFQESC